ncbi:hypothetical protein ACIBU0_17305 [Streptomyces sp. NPDC049627]|uniref:hypothetical protein n=1 Tax=Streptomyces sp. NPDC049627 TaxID=3365595 RepID=UPI0037AE2958
MEVDTPRPRRRGRTALLIAAAAVLGVLAGTCTGYLIQADREPTKLPPLSQPVIGRAEGEPELLSAARDRRVKTDGDLRKLLVERPKGAKDTDNEAGSDGWVGLAEYADLYRGPSGTFSRLASDEFRRAATVSWKVGETYIAESFLVQFHQEDKLSAAGWAENGTHWAEKEDDTRSWHLPGTGEDNGTVFVHDTPERKPGYLPLYSAEAYAWRGDICMEIRIWDSKPIPKAKIMNLARQQMEKL